MREPEGPVGSADITPSGGPLADGCAERLVRVLKENLRWVRRFATIEELRSMLRAFQRSYNQSWIIKRHGYRMPAQVRVEQTDPILMAAYASRGLSNARTGTAQPNREACLTP